MRIQSVGSQETTLSGEGPGSHPMCAGDFSNKGHLWSGPVRTQSLRLNEAGMPVNGSSKTNTVSDALASLLRNY